MSKSDESMLAKVFGKAAIILQRMIVEVPLPMPCSEMSSPSHMRSAEPAVIAVIARNQSFGVIVTVPVVDCVTTVWNKIKIYATDCKTARGIEIMRVHWLILRRPVSPSLLSSSMRGIAFVRSCITIDAVMYGERPTRIIERLVKPPPEMRLMKPPRSVPLINLSTAPLNV